VSQDSWRRLSLATKHGNEVRYENLESLGIGYCNQLKRILPIHPAFESPEKGQH